MGLDNIPHKYPCQSQGTAVLVPLLNADGEPLFIEGTDTPHMQIDCDQTMACDGCPWKKVLGSRAGSAVGIFGTSCWYRGKYGIHLLSSVGINALDLYGDDEAYVRPSVLRGLADEIMDRFADEHWNRQDTIMVDGENVADQVWYLHDWLLWTALECDGADAWY